MYDNRADPRYPRHPGEIKDMETLRQVIDGYDTGIRYMDSHIGQLFEALQAQGVLDDLVIIISSDHGENLGELGIYAEHGTADAITCRVPLIIRWPGCQPGSTDSGLHYNLDLMPTLNELLGGMPRPSWDGQSFADSITHGLNTGRDYLVLSQNAHVCQRSVRFGSLLYMRTWHDGYRLHPEKMLYDLDQDPHEQFDLAENKPELCEQAETYLSAWTRQMQASMPHGYTLDPMQTVLAEGGPTHARGMLPSYIKRLEATGRGWAVPELIRRHPQEFENHP
jgi:arylsulfatase A-like enzyme